MTTYDQVSTFLRNFKDKLKVFDIYYARREKNIQAQLNLEINESQRLDYIENLAPENYYAGPKNENYQQASIEYWEFGTEVKGTEVYVKISMGRPNQRVLCISFHESEFPMTYPFKS